MKTKKNRFLTQKDLLTKTSTFFILLILLFSFSLPQMAKAAYMPDGGGGKKPKFDVGGALRFNYRYMTWKDETYAKIANAQGGEFLLDTFRFDINGSYKGLKLSTEYRFYAGYNMLHHGYVEYDVNKNNRFQLGISQVPFNIQPYASHNWFFSIGYYVGLEDNYDAGLKYIHYHGPWTIKAAFYKNSGGNYTGHSLASSRYSYDVVPARKSLAGMTSNNREVNQFDLKIAYTIKHGKLGSTKLSFSGQYGQLYNDKLNEFGNHNAWALNLNGYYGRFNVQLGAIRMAQNPKTLPGIPNDRVVMGAYDFPYEVAAKGNIYIVGLAYKVPVKWGPITSLNFYNDFSMYDKDKKSFYNTFHNVTGCAISAGKVYTYIDFANGKNDPWLGQFTGLGPGVKNAKWKLRFNVNIGYYF